MSANTQIPPVENPAIPIAETSTLHEPVTVPTDNPNVVLRQLTPADAGTVFGTFRSAMRDMYGGGHAYDAYSTLEDTQEHIAGAGGNEGNRHLILGVWESGKFAGEVSLRPHKFNKEYIEKRGHSVDVIDYWLHPDYRGRGLAQLAARTASRYSFQERGAGEVHAAVAETNPRSLRVIEPIGFVAMGRGWYGLTPEKFEAAGDKSVH